MFANNRLLVIITGFVVLVSGFTTLRSCTGGPQQLAVMQVVPTAPVPDADTPADTIKTLTANVAAMTSEVETLRLEGQRLREENKTLLTDRAQVEENIMARVHLEWLEREHARTTHEEENTTRLAKLAKRIEHLSSALGRQRDQGAALPVGQGALTPGTGAHAPTSLVWIDPLDTNAHSGLDPTTLTPDLPPPPGLLQGLAPETPTEPEPVPAYTVPRNATLLGATALTALVGRVPVHGQVRDPMPFKVITGADNLAANGHTVPGVRGMVWSGTAIGDWTLSCITGRLDSVTFVFDDGTIRTISTEGGEALAWISDHQGFPCISGKRKTNAPAFLSQRIAVTALQAAAEAAAASQTTVSIEPHGASSGQVTGDHGAYVLGKTVSSASKEITRWLTERQSQSFDAVVARAGVRLAIHIDHELTIDLEPQGRRLDYASMPHAHHVTRLD